MVHYRKADTRRRVVKLPQCEGVVAIEGLGMPTGRQSAATVSTARQSVGGGGRALPLGRQAEKCCTEWGRAWGGGQLKVLFIFA